MNIVTTLDEKIAGRHLLSHPFYQRWSAGELTMPELQEYASEYYHYSAAFPTFLSAIHSGCSDISVRQEILENLIEEERGPENHPELWLRFCEGLGMKREEVRSSHPSDETTAVIQTLRDICRQDSHAGVAALYAYESQIPAVSASKIEGLAKFYEMTDPRAISFFQVHMEADVEHSATTAQLVDQLCDTPEKKREAEAAVDSTLAALYRFLDQIPVPVMVN